jgi:hypothetical protein
MGIYRAKPSVVFTGSYAVGGNGGVNTFDITDKVTKFRWVGDVTFQWIVARTAGASTTDMTLNASLDGGTTYTALVAFTQIAASGNGIKQVTIPGGALIQAAITEGAGTTATITLYIAGFCEGGAG